MKLDAVDGELFVAQAHDLALGGPCGDFKAVGQGLAFDDERVIAGGLKRSGHSNKNTGARMMDR